MIGAGAAADIDECVALWVTAVAAREGGTAPEGTAERCLAKFSPRPVSFAVARADDGGAGSDGRDGGESDNPIRGFGLVTPPGNGRPTDPPDAAYLGLLAVAPDAQGRGIGARLLDHLVADAREGDQAALVLHVLASNTAAVRLYESRGWRSIGAPFAHPLTGGPTQTYELRFG